jgi:hypothetical protein
MKSRVTVAVLLRGTVTVYYVATNEIGDEIKSRNALGIHSWGKFVVVLNLYSAMTSYRGVEL